MIGKENIFKPKALFFDEENIQARANGIGKTLSLNTKLGGDVFLGNYNSTVRTQGRVVIGNVFQEDVGLQVVFGNDLNLSSGGYFILGHTDGTNIAMDKNGIQARNDGAASSLFLNEDGGHLYSKGVVNIGDHRNMQYNSSTGQIGYDNSSRRYKRNIRELKDDWNKILHARPVKYTREASPDYWEYGYIAEEMDSIGLTNLVHYDQEGRPEDYNYERMVVYLTEMIKDLKKSYDELSAKVISLTELQD